MAENNSANIPIISLTSFSPTISGSTTSGTTTYTENQAYYYQIGNMIWLTGLIEISGNTGTGNAIIGNFPIPIANKSGYYPTGSCMISAGFWPWSNAGCCFILGGPNQNYVNLCSSSSYAVSGSGFVNVSNHPLIIYFTITYLVS